jgi:DNA-binding transcriptional MerR regulator
MALRVSELADKVGVSADTVRYYERIGLVSQPARSPSGYRQYDDDVAWRLKFIKGAQSLGLKLSEIRELLEIQDKGACPCGHTKALIDNRMAEIDQELDRLSALRKELEAMSRLECLDSSERVGAWPCEIEFVKRGGD